MLFPGREVVSQEREGGVLLFLINDAVFAEHGIRIRISAHEIFEEDRGRR